MMMRRVSSALVAWMWMATIANVAAAAVTGNPGEVEEARLAIRTKQFEHAVALLQRQARAGNADAQYLLGLAQWNGVGIAPDREAARASLQRAAEGGIAPAAYALAALLGAGTDREREQAVSWLSRAASAGYAPAVALQSSHALALQDGRLAPGLAVDLRFAVARAAARTDDAALLTASGGREFARRRAEFGQTLLFDAASTGSAETVKVLLGAGAEIDAQDDFGETPLMFAAEQPAVAVTRLLLAAGARPDAADKVGRTALFRAALTNRPEQIAVLLAAGASIDHADQRGWTAVDVAQQFERTAALDGLRAQGGHSGSGAAAAPRVVAGIDATRTGVLYRGWSPLAISAARDDAVDIRRRLAAGADPEATTPDGETPLQIAIEARAGGAARALIALGARCDRAGPDGRDAFDRMVRSGDATLIAELAGLGVKLAEGARGARLLGLAVRRGDAAMTRALLSAGLNAAAADETRTTPLMLAAGYGDLEMIKLLLDRGARPDAVDARGRTALHHAAAAGSSQAVAVLLAVPREIDLADGSGVTPLIAAIRSGSAATVERLLAAGAAVDGREPALNVAAATGRADIVGAILTRRPSIDAADAFGDTALMAAARNGDAATSIRLLSAGANPRLRNRERAAAADVAEARGYMELASRLRN